MMGKMQCSIFDFRDCITCAREISPYNKGVGQQHRARAKRKRRKAYLKRKKKATRGKRKARGKKESRPTE
jgi:hypothetical protein